jgi:hypothetical protein
MFNKLRAWKTRRTEAARANRVKEARAILLRRSRNLGAPLSLRVNLNAPNNRQAINNARKAINNARTLNAARRLATKRAAYNKLYRTLSNNAILRLAGYSTHRIAVAQNRR